MHLLVRILAYGGLAASAMLCGWGAYHSDVHRGTNGAIALGSLIALGLLAAWEISRLVGDRATDFIFNDEGEGVKDPEFEKAEDVWRAGDYLEAVRMMRDYFARHPRELFVQMRIAEIYETNLNNPLAAALEYEEVLKKPLHPERWGMRAIHLCNLYSKLHQQEKATALLERIASEFSQTAAAKKARQKLGLPEPEPPPVPAPEPEPEPEPAPEPPKDKGPSLPPGFRPK
jgi:hypothetical protein